jgi:hypothetical protein
MDILYYSNYCKHSQKVIQFLAKNNFTNKLNFICIDKRKRDPKTNQTYIELENGKSVILPPNIHNVPSLLLVKQNYRVILGDEIIGLFQPKVEEENNHATQREGEPSGYYLPSSNSGMNIVSEQFTYYNMTPEELSAKGKGGNRQMYNYVLANDSPPVINTPPDTYRPDKLSNGISLDTLQQKRNEEISQSMVPSPFTI